MSRDQKMFNCSEVHEHDYVISLYEDKEKIRKFLKDNCKNGNIKYTTHSRLYDIIKEELGIDKKPSNSNKDNCCSETMGWRRHN